MAGNMKWVIVLVAHDDADLEPQVIKEAIGVDEDEHLAAFLRGGELIATTMDDSEQDVEMLRQEIEKQSLR